MKRLSSSIQILCQNKRRGVSLIIAMSAAALLLGLALSIIYSSSLPLARANAKMTRERSYRLAKSFSEVLDIELHAYKTERHDIGADAEDIAPENTFYRYANDLLEGIYGEYDPDRPELTTYYYTAAVGDDDYGVITVKLRKESAQNDEDAVVGGSFDWSDRALGTDQAENKTFIRYLFYVDTTVALDGETFTYSTEYYRKDSFIPHYTWNGSLSGVYEVYYNRDNSSWYLDSNYATPMERAYHQIKVPAPTLDDPEAYIWEDDLSNPEEVTITYEYYSDPDDPGLGSKEISYKIFEQTYLELDN